MARKKMEAAIYHGQIINIADTQNHQFEVGCRFTFSNASYNDTFVVAGKKTEPGTEYRQVVGAKSGEVWMLLSSLRNEVAAGAIAFIEKESSVEKTKEKKDKKSKTNKNG